MYTMQYRIEQSLLRTATRRFSNAGRTATQRRHGGQYEGKYTCGGSGVRLSSMRWAASPRSASKRCIGGGRYSRMMDMGGSPSAATDKSNTFRLNKGNKNNKLKAVAFDFRVLTTSWKDEETQGQGKEQQQSHGNTGNPSGTSNESNATLITSASIKPDAGMVNSIASLLNVQIGSQDPTSYNQRSEEVSISNIANTIETANTPSKTATATSSASSASPLNQDIRAKYASKLKGGLAGIELAKSQVEETVQRGDAAGHMAARKIVAGTAASSSTPKWMALSGTGKLLGYLSNRSIHIALLPGDPTSDQVDPQMHYLSKQMKDIVIDLVLDAEQSASQTVTSLEGKLPKDVEMSRVMVVSDRDDYLRAARDAGMITCRLRKPNSRRGNITTHYDVEDVPQIQEVIDEIAGISFNAVLNR